MENAKICNSDRPAWTRFPVVATTTEFALNRCNGVSNCIADSFIHLHPNLTSICRSLAMVDTPRITQCDKLTNRELDATLVYRCKGRPSLFCDWLDMDKTMLPVLSVISMLLWPTLTSINLNLAAVTIYKLIAETYAFRMESAGRGVQASTVQGLGWVYIHFYSVLEEHSTIQARSLSSYCFIHHDDALLELL